MSNSITSPERISIFIPSLSQGGAERVFAHLANELAQKGYVVDLVLTRQEGIYLNEVSEKVNIIDLRSKRTITSLLPLTRYLKENQPVALLSALQHSNLVAIVASKMSRLPHRIIISERGDPRRPVSQNLILNWAWQQIIRVLYPRADLIISVSDGIKKALEDSFKIKAELIQTINNPIELRSISALSNESVLHPWLKQKDRPVFLAVGRLEKVKGFDILLHAFKRLLDTTPARLIVLGEGSKRNSLLQLAQDLSISSDVDFVGFESNPFKWMSLSDVFVLSSHSEGFPNSMIQAMSCGLKIVSTDCDYGPREILEFGRWGTLCPVNNANALAEAMRVSLSSATSPEVRLRAADFGVDKIVSKYEMALGVSSLNANESPK